MAGLLVFLLDLLLYEFLTLCDLCDAELRLRAILGVGVGPAVDLAIGFRWVAWLLRVLVIVAFVFAFLDSELGFLSNWVLNRSNNSDRRFGLGVGVGSGIGIGGGIV